MRNSGNTPSSKPLFFVAEQWNHKKGSWVIQEEWEIYLHSWNSKGNLQPTEDKDLIALSRGHLDHYGQQEIICHRSVLVSLTPCFVILSICPSIYFPVSYQVAKSLLQRAYFYCVYSVSFTGRLHLSILARSLEMHLSRRSWQLLDSQETESKLVLCESYSKCNSCVLQNIFLTEFSQAKLWLFCQYLLNSSVLAFSKIALGLANTKKQHCWREWQARQPPPSPSHASSHCSSHSVSNKRSSLSKTALQRPVSLLSHSKAARYQGHSTVTHCLTPGRTTPPCTPGRFAARSRQLTGNNRWLATERFQSKSIIQSLHRHMINCLPFNCL